MWRPSIVAAATSTGDSRPPHSRQQVARLWRAGAKDDTVYHGLAIWTIFECTTPTCAESYIAAVEEFAAVMRSAGMDVDVAHPRGL